MNFFLSIDTSTTICSVAIYQDSLTIFYSENTNENSHSEKLAEMVFVALSNCNLKPIDLKAVLLSIGPGSYTGLRIGSSFCKGFCFGLNIPIVTIDSLQALAFHFLHSHKTESNHLICSMIDARRMEVYINLFNEFGHPIYDMKSVVVDENFLENELKKNKIHFIGNGVEKCTDILKHENAILHPEVYCSSNFLGEFMMKKFEQSDFTNIAYFEPIYLKEFYTKPSNKFVL